MLFDSTLIIFSNWLTYNLLNKSLIFNFDSRIFFNSFLLCFVGLPILFLEESLEIIFSFSLIFWVLLTSLSGFFRFGVRDFLLNFKSKQEDNIKRILIYGTSSEAVQIFASLRLNPSYEVKHFIDDDPRKRERYLDNIKIISPLEIEKIYKDIDQVLIASPFENKRNRKNFLQILEKLNLPVLEINPAKDNEKRKLLIDSFKPLNIDDLINKRNESSAEFNYKEKIIKNKVVLVTGGGGSIGSELCRKIISLEPKLLIIIENNEANLYSISNDLLQFSDEANFKFILTSIGNRALLEKIIIENKVDMIFHAAAYKHVPLVESNPIEGIKNNVIFTKLLCELASTLNVKHMILISTDKAVRPTNIMGASKRLAEIILQSYAEKEKFIKSNESFTIFAMVRFGNVIGSSGSVLPLFQKQIDYGGPITLTDPNIIRYFMTITEAANLVLEASYLAKGGELFLLDMGQPIKIKYLAEQLVRLNGLRLKTKKFPKGDIEIKVIGLRPGEKLYEELLIDGRSEKTTNDLIYKAKEKFIYSEDLWSKLDSLNNSCNELNFDKTLNLLRQLVPEWSLDT